MKLINHEVLASDTTIKFIANHESIAFFPFSSQHKDIKFAGLSYEDDYRGNALAGILTPTTVEIRFHKLFSDDSVKALMLRVIAVIDISKNSGREIYYQGRELSL